MMNPTAHPKTDPHDELRGCQEEARNNFRPEAKFTGRERKRERERTRERKRDREGVGEGELSWSIWGFVLK